MIDKLLVSAYLNIGNIWHHDAKVIGTCWGFQLVHNITEQIAMNNPNKSLPMVMLDDANEALAAKDARISELEKRMRPMPPSNFDLTEQEQFIRRRADEIFDENQADERADDYMYMNEEMCREAAAIEWGAMQALAAQQQAGPAEAEPFTNKEVDAIIEALEPATHSEDGREVPEVVGYLYGTPTGPYISRADYKGHPRDELMTVAQHERIVAAKDAEIVRQRRIAEAMQEKEQIAQAERTKLALQLAAQPARQVGGDERAKFNAWNNGADCPLAGRDTKTGAWMAWKARAALGRD